MRLYGSKYSYMKQMIYTLMYGFNKQFLFYNGCLHTYIVSSYL